MAAGLGFKTFNTGDVLSATDVNGYLMQGILVFASAAARDAAITAPAEGQFAYLKDTDVTTYYTGSAWANVDSTGMTNPMTTTGDTIYSSSGSTPARLGIGTAGQVLQVNSGATAPEWVTPSSGATLVGTAVYSSSDQTIPNGTFTTVTYGNEYWDTNSFHSTVTDTGRITIPSGKGGKYLVFAYGTWVGNASGNRELRIRKNGSTILANNRTTVGGASTTMQMTQQFDLVATDFIELQIFQQSGGNLDWFGTGSFAGSLFAVTYLGA